MKQTPNINLPILESGDKYLKETQNQAFTTIDTEIKGLTNSLNALDNVEGSIIEFQKDINRLDASYNSMANETIPSINASLDTIAILCNNCIGDGIVDNSPLIQKYIDDNGDNLTLKFKNGMFKLNSDIDFKGKSINLIVSEKTEFVGVGRFPTFDTNVWHEKKGTFYTLSPGNGKTSPGDGTIPLIRHGDSALSTEITPQNSYVGNACSAFFSAKTGNSQGDVWAINPILVVDEGFENISICAELDVDNFSSQPKPIGLLMSGRGNNCQHGMLITRHGNGSKWLNGITLNNVNDAINIENAISSGILVKNVGANGLYIDNAKVGSLIQNTINNGVRLLNNNGIGMSIEGQNENHLQLRVKDDTNPTSFVQAHFKADGTVAYGVTKNGGVKIGGGTYINKHISFEIDLDFGTIGGKTQVFKNTPCVGVVQGDTVTVTPKGQGISSSVIWNSLSGTDEVQVRLTNFTDTSVIVGSRTFRIDVWKH